MPWTSCCWPATSIICKVTGLDGKGGIGWPPEAAAPVGAGVAWRAAALALPTIIPAASMTETRPNPRRFGKTLISRILHNLLLHLRRTSIGGRTEFFAD